MGSEFFMDVVANCEHWIGGFSTIDARAVLRENLIELRFTQFSARYNLRLTERAIASDIHKRMRNYPLLQLLSISFQKSHPPDENPFSLQGMELVASSEMEGQLRWAVFAASEHGSFVEVAECEYRNAATITLTPNGFGVTYDLEPDSRVISVLDVINDSQAEVVLAWEENRLTIFSEGIVSAELECLLSEEEVLYLIQDSKKSYLVLFADNGFANNPMGNLFQLDQPHHVVARSANKKILLVSGDGGSQAKYYDREGSVFNVTLPQEREVDTRGLCLE